MDPPLSNNDHGPTARTKKNKNKKTSLPFIGSLEKRQSTVGRCTCGAKCCASDCFFLALRNVKIMLPSYFFPKTSRPFFDEKRW